MTRRRGAVAAVAVAAALLLLPACTSSRTTSATKVVARQVSRTTLAGAELHYGASARVWPGIVYQPDVVVIGGGANSVRTVSADGMWWTLDAHASGVHDLAVGKVMMVTTHGTGRVLKLVPAADSVRVLIGPVGLADVIRDADISSAAPIALSSPLFYPVPGAPGSDAGATLNSFGAHGTQATLAAVRRPIPRTATETSDGGLPAPTTLPSPVAAGPFTFTPLWDSNGIGVRASIVHGNGHFVASFQLHLATPTVSFRLVIDDGTVKQATITVHGAGGIHVHIDAVQLDSSGEFKGTTIAVPIVLSVPLGAGPLELSLTQDLSLTPQVLGKGFLDSQGDYGLSGDLTFGIGVPNGAQARVSSIVEPMSKNTASYGLATNSLSFGWGIRASVGVGLGGFSAGAFYELQFSGAVAAEVGQNVLNPGCVHDSLMVHSLYGLGYHVPSLVMKAVNLFLSVVGVGPIPADGEIVRGPFTLWSPKPVEYCPGYDH